MGNAYKGLGLIEALLSLSFRSHRTIIYAARRAIGPLHTEG